MKYFFTFLFLFLFLISCEKEIHSPQEQLIEAIQSKIDHTGKISDVYVLENEVICINLDCDQKKYTSSDLTFSIYSREGMFMRGVDKYFEVVEWKESPTVLLRGKWVQDSPFEHTGEKCRGN